MPPSGYERRKVAKSRVREIEKVTERGIARDRRSRAGHEPLLAARIPILGIEIELQRHAAVLIRRYGDVPMDHADASLVVLGQALGIDCVFTTDRKGFTTYRRIRDRGFRIVPEQ